MELPIDLLSVLLVTGIVFTGTLLQSSLGFGLGPIAVPLLVLVHPAFIPGPLLLSALALTLLMARRDHRSIHIQGVKWAIPGRVAGAIFGASLLSIIPEDSMSALFGAMVILAVFISFSKIKLTLKPLNIFSAGTLSGLMGTTSAIGGAPMALVYQNQKGPEIRGTLACIFIFGTIISISSLVVIGRFGLREVYMALILLPGILLGFWSSRLTVRLLDKGLTKPAILTVSAVVGIIVLIKSLL
ncbi:MAG: sulfite exporter TauE/SafE family protein [Deltaproteobacteria bacterium]|nr:sulfite exporter TauE/SafE family protein [Deltaproteobacteria bacterium]